MYTRICYKMNKFFKAFFSEAMLYRLKTFFIGLRLLVTPGQKYYFYMYLVSHSTYY